MQVRRLVCPTRGCRQTFREQMPGVLERYQRRAARLTRHVKAVVEELAGRAGSRLLGGRRPRRGIRPYPQDPASSQVRARLWWQPVRPEGGLLPPAGADPSGAQVHQVRCGAPHDRPARSAHQDSPQAPRGAEEGTDRGRCRLGGQEVRLRLTDRWAAEPEHRFPCLEAAAPRRGSSGEQRGCALGTCTSPGRCCGRSRSKSETRSGSRPYPPERPTETDNVEGPHRERWGPSTYCPVRAMAEDTRFELVRGCPQHAFQMFVWGFGGVRERSDLRGSTVRWQR